MQQQLDQQIATMLVELSCCRKLKLSVQGRRKQQKQQKWMLSLSSGFKSVELKHSSHYTALLPSFFFRHHLLFFVGMGGDTYWLLTHFQAYSAQFSVTSA